MSNKIITFKKKPLSIEKELPKIDYIRHQVKDLIHQNTFREVTPDTKHHISGIYMIYIDNFSSEKIIPIYIGQSNDIQKRYKKHFLEILALNRLSYDEYYTYFFSKTHSFYEGQFKACKIFKYMIENNCTLKDFHMTILEEVELQHLKEKEQEYFKKLLPSFFGFNQLNSLLKVLDLRLSNTKLDDSEMDSYLDILTDDVEGMNCYYEKGFTKFNFEHAFPKKVPENESLKSEIRQKCNNVNFKINELCNYYIPGFEKQQKEIQTLREKTKELYDEYTMVRDECKEALSLLENELRLQFKKHKLYSEKAIINFKNSIIDQNSSDYKEEFYKYLSSKSCNLNFHEMYKNKIEILREKLQQYYNQQTLYHDSDNLLMKIKKQITDERYKLILPSAKYSNFPLKDRKNDVPIKINTGNVINTCHIQLYISNNGQSRSIDFNKEPFIIRLDYCYIGYDNNKVENMYYIDNESTRNCQSGVEYFEKDFYNTFAFKKERFQISSMINNELYNSFISLLAEFKHGINDYTIKDKELVKLSAVLKEIQQLTDEKTRFNIVFSESVTCLNICLVNEGLRKNAFIEKLLGKKLNKV
jgi:hypothetical protein